ncbi:Serine/threonine-protein phosphatase 2B catalytic subunit alpha [Bulinus truncatus]|nr:Serine/threonine-protein phosphatase 2B catalytic subunit alpha [Bulinus truncatus]
MKDVPLPLRNVLSEKQIFSNKGVPNIELLRRHLEGEGKLELAAVKKILNLAVDIFAKEDNVLLIDGTVKVVGALHGHFYDLMTILYKQPINPDITLLFLGSYIHHGQFGIETVIYLFALKILNPTKTFLLRGNQDCRLIGETQFKTECTSKYDILLYRWVMEAFDYLPLAAVVNTLAFCVHGGISPKLKYVRDICQLYRFREPHKRGLLTDLLWSDAALESTEVLSKREFSFNLDRNISVSYSLGALLEFLRTNNLRMLIRSNQPLIEGVYIHTIEDNGISRLPFISLCSATNLLNYRNKGGYLIISPNSLCLRQIAWVPQPYALPLSMNALEWSFPFVIKKVMLLLADLLDVQEGLFTFDMERKVTASMKKKEYKVTIYFTENLDIESTQCECPRGDYRCSHAAALYFFCKNNVSKTDMECNWKKARMTAGCDIKSTDELFPGDNFRALQGTVTDEDRSWLFNELQTQASFTGMCWLMSPEPSTSMPDLPVIDNLVSSSGFKDALDKRHYFKHHFALSPEAISKIADITAGQHTNDYWHLARKGRITASKFGTVLRSKTRNAALGHRLIASANISNVKSVAW